MMKKSLYFGYSGDIEETDIPGWKGIDSNAASSEAEGIGDGDPEVSGDDEGPFQCAHKLHGDQRHPFPGGEGLKPHPGSSFQLGIQKGGQVCGPDGTIDNPEAGELSDLVSSNTRTGQLRQD